MTAYLASIAEKPSHQRRKDAWKAMKSFWERTDPALIDAAMCRAYAAQRRAGPATIRYELLQGFPDDWARIPWRGKPAEECPDGPQYRAYGNSMSVNCMVWIGERLQAVMEAADE